MFARFMFLFIFGLSALALLLANLGLHSSNFSHDFQELAPYRPGQCLELGCSLQAAWDSQVATWLPSDHESRTAAR